MAEPINGHSRLPADLSGDEHCPALHRSFSAHGKSQRFALSMQDAVKDDHIGPGYFKFGVV